MRLIQRKNGTVPKNVIEIIKSLKKYHSLTNKIIEQQNKREIEFDLESETESEIYEKVNDLVIP